MSVKGSNHSFHGQANQQQAQERDENYNARQNSVVHFANDIPLVVVEIPLNGKIAKLPIFEFSSPDSLALSFCRKYQLEEKLKKPIKKFIEQQMQNALSARQKQNVLDNDQHNKRTLVKSQSTAQISQTQYQRNEMTQQNYNNQTSQKDNYQGQNLNNLQEQNNFNEEYKEEQRGSKKNFQNGNRNYNKSEKQLEDNQDEQQQNNKKHKNQFQHEQQTRNNEAQHQSFQKLKHKDFFTENSETENELSDVADLRKPVSKPVKNANQINTQQKSLQKNKQSQSSALLTREQNYEVDEKEQLQPQISLKDSTLQQPKKSNRYENIPDIITQQTQTRSILKQNKSQENLFKNNDLLNGQNERQTHKNQQVQNNNINFVKNENIQRFDNTRQTKTYNQEDADLNTIQQQKVNSSPTEIYNDGDLENFQNQKSKKTQSNSAKGIQKEFAQNDRKQQQIQNIYEIQNPSKAQVKKNIVKIDQESAQYTFNEDESNDLDEVIQNKDFKAGRDINQESNQQFKNQKLNSDPHQNNIQNHIHRQEPEYDEASQIQNKKKVPSQQINNQAKSNMQINQDKPKQKINQQQERIKHQNIQENYVNDEEDTEVDELQQMPQPKKQEPLQIQNKKNQSQFTKNKQNLNKNNHEEQQNYDQAYQRQNTFDGTENDNDNDHFNKVNEAQDLVQNPQLLNLLSQPIKRAPNGALQRNIKNIVKEENENQIPKTKQVIQNKIRDEAFNSNNVFNNITLEQHNEVSDFVAENFQSQNQVQPPQNQLHINQGNNNLPISPQSYMSPPPQRYLSPQSNSNLSYPQQVLQQNTFMSPVGQPKQNMYKQTNVAIPQDNNNFQPIQNNMNNIQQINRQINPQIPNNQNQNPFYQNNMLSPLNKNYQGQNYQENLNYYSNQGYQQQISSPYQQNNLNKYPQNSQSLANLGLNQSFLNNNNNTINTSINSSIINKSFTPRRKIFEDSNNKFIRNQPILPQNIMHDQRINEQQQQLYITPNKNSTSTPLRYRNQENPQYQQQYQRQNFVFPSRSISPNPTNNFVNQQKTNYQQQPLNQQSLQFAPNNRPAFLNQSPLQNPQKLINNPYQQQFFEQQKQQNLNIQPPQSQNPMMTQQQQFNQVPQFFSQNQNQPYLVQNNQPLYQQNIQNNIIDNQNKSPRNQIMLPSDQKSFKNNINFQANSDAFQKLHETPSPNFAPDIEKSSQKINTQNNDRNRTPSPTQIKSTNSNFNYKNIPLFEKIKLQQQEQFKQLGFDNSNQQQANQNIQNNTQIQPASNNISINHADKNGTEKINNQPQKQQHKNYVQQKDYCIIDDIKSSGVREDDFYDNNQQNSQRTSVVKEELDIIQNGILFSLNANYQDNKQQNSCIKDLFHLLDSKNQGWISQSQIDFSKLPSHFQLRLELNQLLEELFMQFKTVDIDKFCNTMTSKYPQIIQHCNSLFSTNKHQNNVIPQQQIRPPSFGLSKDTPVFQ